VKQIEKGDKDRMKMRNVLRVWLRMTVLPPPLRQTFDISRLLTAKTGSKFTDIVMLVVFGQVTWQCGTVQPFSNIDRPLFLTFSVERIHCIDFP